MTDIMYMGFLHITQTPPTVLDSNRTCYRTYTETPIGSRKVHVVQVHSIPPALAKFMKRVQQELGYNCKADQSAHYW